MAIMSTPPPAQAVIDGRNSNVELLRIVGMIMIIWCHYLSKDSIDWGSIQLRSFNSFFNSLGGVGDDLFFGISAYYLCATKSTTFKQSLTQSLKQSLKRAWKIEKQLLFYCWLLLLVMCFVQFVCHAFVLYTEDALATLAIKSISPAFHCLLWYPTAYIIIVLLLPVLNMFLHYIGRTGHVGLAFFLFVGAAIVPPTQLSFSLTFLLFVYLYIIISALRWYYPDFFLKSDVWKLLLPAGVITGVVHVLIACSIKPYQYGAWFNSPQRFPALFISLSLLCAALQRTPRASRIINFAASGTFAAYCIHQYPWCDQIAKQLLVLDDSVTSLPGHQRVLLRMAAGVVVFIAAVLFDAVRRFIFRAWDKLFVRCSCASAATGRFQRWISGKFAVFTAEPADSGVGTKVGVETGTSVGQM